MIISAKSKILAVIAVSSLALAPANGASNANSDVAVGPQYDTTHVYVAADKIDAFVASFTATFNGKPTPRQVTGVTPTPSRTAFQAIRTPYGGLSIFAFQTPIPYPFGQERYGYLVTDMDKAIKEARSAGAEVVVEPFKDPIGRDAVIQWPGGVKMQLYWHFTAPSSAPLKTIPESRVYISRDRASEFVRDFLRFSHGQLISDNKKADAGEIGLPGKTFRRIQLQSKFGKMLVLATDGHLPYPFGYELTGYQVTNLSDTLEKAKASGAQIISKQYDAKDRRTAIIKFPGGYIAEAHSVRSE